MAWEFAPKRAVIFRHLINRVSFLVCWRLADVVTVPNQFSASDNGDYRSISIFPILSKVFEKIVGGKLRYFLESNSLLLSSQFRIVGAC